MKIKMQPKIVEVALRDGLQNEKALLPTDLRVEFARRLATAGLKNLEIGSFVREDRIPQMKGSRNVIQGCFDLQTKGGIPSDVHFSALVPNEVGLQSARQTPLREIAVFAGASETFSRKNINCSIEESFERFSPVFKEAKKTGMKVRGYLSVCFGCPYEGEVPVDRVVQLAGRMSDLGAYEISIGDTIGVATPDQVENLFSALEKRVPLSKVAGHFHDTCRTALANIWASYQMGIHTFDSSFGGLGGCPYAPGASGNVATEDVLYLFSHAFPEMKTTLDNLAEVNAWAVKNLTPQIGKNFSRFHPSVSCG